MRTSLSLGDMAAYTASQIASVFPDGATVDNDWPRIVATAMERVELCFSRIRQRYYRDADGQVLFNHLNTDQYASYLYLLANTIFKQNGNETLASKLYALNKALHSLDVFYKVELPEVFIFFHPIGTVIGRASFGNYLCVYQNCTIGGDLENNHPVLGEGVALFNGARVAGQAKIGSNCLLSSGAAVFGESVPGDSVVFGMSPQLIVKPTDRNVRRDIFENPPI